jgi:Mrp family chromosome partitioning ATPase
MFVFRLIKRYFITFTLTIGFCLGFAQYLNETTIPQYESSIQLFISTPTPVLDISSLASGSNFGAQRVKSYAQILAGPSTLNPVIEQLGLSTNWRELSGNISTNAPLDTVLLNVTVKNPDPILCAAIANRIAIQFQDTVKNVESNNPSTSVPLKVSIVKNAQPNFSPVAPKKELNFLISIVLGLMIGFAYIGIIFIFDQRVKNETHLFGYQLVGVIKFDKKVREIPLTNAIETNSLRSELFRKMRSTIHFSLLSPKSGGSIILIGSAVPSEGKSVTAASLAVAYASTGLRTLLVDCDLRKPSQHALFERSGFSISRNSIKYGLNALIKDNAKPIYQTFEKIPNLSVLFAGEGIFDPGKNFGSKRYATLVKNFKSNFDIIVFDTPPILLVGDAIDLAEYSDINLMVVKAGSTRVAQLSRCLAVFEKINKKADGVIMNMTPSGRTADDYGYGYGYSYKSIPTLEKGVSGYSGYNARNSQYENLYLEYTKAKKEKQSHKRPWQLLSKRNVRLLLIKYVKTVGLWLKKKRIRLSGNFNSKTTSPELERFDVEQIIKKIEDNIKQKNVTKRRR